MNRMSRVRTLAQQYTNGQLEVCLQDAINDGANRCIAMADKTETVDLLARAGLVRRFLDQGMEITGAMRELGRRMRSLVE